ncbi:hypothetical protein PMAYCL1PPCAC_06094, partial [Pristionchus mayeri]
NYSVFNDILERGAQFQRIPSRWSITHIGMGPSGHHCFSWQLEDAGDSHLWLLLWKTPEGTVMEAIHLNLCRCSLSTDCTRSMRWHTVGASDDSACERTPDCQHLLGNDLCNDLLSAK